MTYTIKEYKDWEGKVSIWRIVDPDGRDIGYNFLLKDLLQIGETIREYLQQYQEKEQQRNNG